MTLVSNKTNQAAFTLIDVMVGMGVLGVVIVSLFASFTFGFNVVKSSRENLQATQILHEKMETIRVYNWNQTTQANFIPKNFKVSISNSPSFFKGTILVTNSNVTETYSDTLRQVIVTVNWTNNNSLRSRSISTFVSKYGMQHYIFSAQ